MAPSVSHCRIILQISTVFPFRSDNLPLALYTDLQYFINRDVLLPARGHMPAQQKETKGRNMEKLKILLLFAIGLTSQVLFAQNRTIQGIVTSAEDGEPLIGATVVLKDNPSVGAATDINGRYTFTIPENAKVLVVSYLGMKTQEVRIMRSNKLNIALQPDEHLLQEVVVTGYGNFTRSSFTGSASTVRADMMKDIPVMSVEQKLQGMTSGVSITSSSGQPGATQSIRIRAWDRSTPRKSLCSSSTAFLSHPEA